MNNLQTIPFDNELVRYWVKAVMAAQPNQNAIPTRIKVLPYETAEQRHDALYHVAQAFAANMLYRGGVYRIEAPVQFAKRDTVNLQAETPAALVITMPNLQATLLAPWQGTNGRRYNGGLELVLFAGDTLPKDKARQLRLRVRRDGEGKWCDLKISAPPAARFMADETKVSDAEKEGLLAFMEIFMNNGNLMEVGKLMLQIITLVYATNDERAKAVEEITFLFNTEPAKT